MRQITLPEMLDAREARAAAQRRFLAEYGRPLLSFSMNIPGPVKDSPLIRRGYAAGKQRILEAMRSAGLPLLTVEEKLAPTGPELLCAVDCAPAELKALCLEAEDRDRLGRLFDMDVLASDGQKLGRAEPRRCVVCGKSGRDCASRRLHSVPELQAAVRAILRESLLELDAAEVEALASRALTDEVNTTPKPGLVDLNNNGSHADMCPETFYRSRDALRSYWADCFRIGRSFAGQRAADCFRALRARGTEADRAMLEATGGVNTHKGAIFTLGTLCGAVGRLWTPEAPCREPTLLAQEAASLCREAVEADFAGVRARGSGRTAGERLYLEHGITGIRGELSAGLPGVIDVALPAFEQALSEGITPNDAGVRALLTLIARGTDSNMVSRGGLQAARLAAEEAARLLPRPAPEQVLALDRAFIARRLSPGGCADLLAVCYFLHGWKNCKDSCGEAPSAPDF